jgi:hypothetical protein
MKNKPTQKDIVLKQLRETGSVSRNWCLSRYISRLSAIMLDLKNEGVTFEGKDKDGDYVYYLYDTPTVREYKVNGVVVARKVTW